MHRKKIAARLSAERYSHVLTFSEALKTASEDHPGIFNDGYRFWSMDKTKVCTELGGRNRDKREITTQKSNVSPVLMYHLSPADSHELLNGNLTERHGAQ